jgi:hypothetical protein
VGILGAIVGPAIRFLPVTDAKFIERCAIGPEPIRHHPLGVAVQLEHFLQELQRSFLVACLRHETLKHLAFVIDGAPEIVPLTVDLHENLVEVPPPEARPHPRNPAFADLGCKQRTKSVLPEPDGLIADVDAPLVKKVFDVPQRKRKSDIHHDGKKDDLGAGTKVPEGASFGHRGKLRDPRSRLNIHRSDRALGCSTKLELVCIGQPT